MNKIFSRIVADLVKSKGDNELSSNVGRLRNEIKKEVDHEGTIFGKIRMLVESFREIIPDEKQRYHAAIKALSTTSKLSRQEIVQAVNKQLEDLKILEKSLLSGIPSWRDELKVMQTASQKIRDEISKLRKQIVHLESEEKGLLNNIATRENEIETVEEAMRELFTDISADITALKGKVEDLRDAGEPASPRPPVERATAQPATPADSIKSEISWPASPPDAEGQMKCPMCGSQMNFHLDGAKWMCYTCAYEEAGK